MKTSGNVTSCAHSLSTYSILDTHTHPQVTHYNTHCWPRAQLFELMFTSWSVFAVDIRKRRLLKFSQSLYFLENSSKIAFAKSLIHFFSKWRNFPLLHCATSASSLKSSQVRFVKSKHTRKKLTRDIPIASRNIPPYFFKNYISLAHFYVAYFLKYILNKFTYPLSLNSLINVDFGDATTRGS